MNSYRPTWAGLCDLCPALRSYEADAKSIAVHAKWDWYGRWIGSFDALRHDLRRVCAEHSIDFREAHRLAVGALLDTYTVARAREQRRRTKSKRG